MAGEFRTKITEKYYNMCVIAVIVRSRFIRGA